MPYLQVISMNLLTTGLSHSKSLVTLMVGIGKVKTRPFLSPSIITSQKARLSMSISAWNSP